MKLIKGRPVFGGYAIGRICIYRRHDLSVSREHAEDKEAELQRFEDARQGGIEDILELINRVEAETGEDSAEGKTAADMLRAHKLMLEDMNYISLVNSIIMSEAVTAESAVAITEEKLSEMLGSMDDEYMKARTLDIRDISDRLLRLLKLCDRDELFIKEPVIVAADELRPSEAAQIDRGKMLSLVMRHGSESSHTAILARTMAIPSLIGADFDDSIDGLLGIVDGHTGELIVDPDKETEERYRRLQREEQKERETLKMLKGRETVTRSGRKLRLYANISGIGDIQDVLLNDAEGIGLFRSEFLYLGKDRYPSEEEQFYAYKTVAQRMAGKKVVIRTMDIGADKQIDYAGLEPEENPAMGLRAIRICLKRPEIFKTQLRAILRASVFGDIAVMYPMITSLKEVERIRGIMEEAKAELREQDVPFKEDIEQGIMIETPAAAVISDLLAQEVDFFSIGTNDLTQYTLAIDRQNEKLEEFYDAHHEAVLRLIKLTVDNAHKAGIWAGICGDLGADPSLTKTFIKMGVDELSVAPGSILPIRKIVRSID